MFYVHVALVYIGIRVHMPLKEETTLPANMAHVWPV